MALTIGILGHGSIGKRHAINAAKLGHDTLIYDPETCSPAARNTVMRDADAIVIATPTPRHALDILDCIEARKPMLIEKPITHPITATLNLVADRLAISGVPAFMGFNLRFRQCIQDTKSELSRIGTPFTADFCVLQKNTRPEYLRDGVISNWLSHEIDLALYLLGPGELRHCDVDRDDSSAELSIRHLIAGTSHLRGDYHTDPEVRGFTIDGERGQIKVDLASDRVSDDDYRNELQSWIDQIQGHGGWCADWQQGVAVERIVIAARELGGLQ